MVAVLTSAEREQLYPVDRRHPIGSLIALVVILAVLSMPSVACLGSSVASEGDAQATPAAGGTQQAQISNPGARDSTYVDKPSSNSALATRESLSTKEGSSTPARGLPSLATPVPGSVQREATAIVRVAQLVRPAVVNITTQQIAYDWYLRPIPEDSGTGSGVIFDRSGLILTNNHVVEGAQGITVALPDGRTFEGQMVGTDPRSDLAVVKISAQDLPVAELGDSDALQIGEQVVAIGNALALPGGPTVTSGIVGALGRSIREENGAVLYDLIQTDAAINPGNSGGPLVNLEGQVVGINTAIANAPGGGIGFAIAINAARPIAEQLVTQGRVVRPWMGVTFQNVTPSLAARYGLGVQKGVLVWNVVRGTPAAKAGLRRGDIIVKFGNDEIDDDVAMLKSLARHKVGDRVTMVVARENQTLQIDIVLEEMPAS